ncbi:MAG: autotransporter-associated beta strand repeat-containing protein, partial [Chthoniobacter sp.]
MQYYAAHAAQPTFSFDPVHSGGTTLGGSGTWDLTNPNWYDGNADVLYPNLTGINAAQAVFGGATGGTVEVNGAIVANSLVFDTTGYALTNADAVATDKITLDGTAGTPTIRVTNAGSTATISAVLAGSAGVNVNGAGKLVLTGVNTLTGAVQLSSGTLRAQGNASALGAGTLILSGGTLELANDTGLAFNRATTVTGNTTIVSDRITSGAGVVHTLGTLSIGANTLRISSGANATGTTAGITFGATTLTASGANFNVDANTNLVLGVVDDGGSGFSLTKSGNGLIQLNNANTYSGATTLSGGVLTTNSLANGGSNSGIGKSSSAAANLTLDGGTLTYTGAAASTDRLFTITANGGSILNNGTGALTYTNTGSQVSAGTGDRTLTLGGSGVFTNVLGGSLTDPITGKLGIVKTGAGTWQLQGNSNSFSGPITISAGTLQRRISGPATNNVVTLSGGNYDLRADGNGTSTPQSIPLGDDLTVIANTTITVDRFGAGIGGFYLTPLNKTIQEHNLTLGGNTLTVTPGNGYGLEFTGTTTLAGNPTLSVGTATASNVVQGLTLTGPVSGTGSNLIKAGAGTLVLGGTNTFGGAGNFIDILGGVVSVNSDAALGDAANGVKLDISATTGVGLRATGTFSTSRTITLGVANNALEVTAGNVLTLAAPFGLGAATNTLTKNDNGILELSGANTAWDGTVTVNAGAIRVSDNAALGTAVGATTVATTVGAAIQLNNVTLAEPFTLTGSGLNTAGALEAVSGSTNTYTGVATFSGATTIGATGTATLNLGGTYGGTTAQAITLAGTGNINFTSAIPNGTSFGAITKINSGTATVASASTAYVNTINVNAGTFQVKGVGAQLGGTGAVTVFTSGAYTIDDSGTALANRGGGRPLTLTGGTFNYLANATSASNETLGVLTTNQGTTGIVNTVPGAGISTLTFASATINTDSTILFSSPATSGVNVIGGTDNKVVFTTAPSLTNSILARWVVSNGGQLDFATYGSGTLSAYAGYNLTQNISQAATTDNLKVTSASTLVPNLFAPQTVSSLYLSGNNAVVNAQAVPLGAPITALTLSSGGILASGGASAVNVPLLSFGGVQALFHVDSGSTLTLNSIVSGSGGWVKSEAGTLVLASPQSNIPGLGANQFTGNFNLAGGTVKLAGGNNTLTPNQFLILSNGVLDLNGTSQEVIGLFSPNAVSGAGGSVRNTSATTASLLIAQDNTNNRTFAGSFQDNINITRSSSNTELFSGVSNFTGNYTTLGGGTTLVDAGAFTGVSSLDINGATFTLSNQGTIDLTDRLNDAAVIRLRGGSLTLLGRAQTASTETVGNIQLVQGANTITATAGGTGVNSVDLTLTGITQRNAGATVNFAVNPIVGSGARVLFTNVPTIDATTDFIIGPWAIVNSGDYAGYNPVTGVGALNQAGYRGYDTGFGTGKTSALTATTALAAGVNVVGNLKLSSSAQLDLTFADNNTVLQLEQGGLLRSNNAVNSNLGTTTIRGILTAGTAASTGATELIEYNNQNTVTINSVIKDTKDTAVGGVGTVTLVKAGAATMVLTAANTYTGGTIVTQGTLTLNATAGANTVVLPAGGVTINTGAVLTESTNAGQIDASNVITINGSGILNLAGAANTLGGLILNNNGGGGGQPTVNSTTGGSVINLNGNITATPQNVQTVATVVGRIDFGSTQRTITVNANPVAGAELFGGFNLQGVINSSGGFIKQGNGVLQLISQQLYTGPTEIAAGTLQLSTATNVGSRFSDYTLDAGAYLNLNNVTTNLGSLGGAGSVFSSTGAPTLTVGFSDNDSTFSGKFLRFSDATTNDVNIVKIGAGNMSLTGAQTLLQTSTGTLTVNQGTVTYAGAGQGFFATSIVNSGGTLVLDNTTTHLDNRLGGNSRNLQVAGGQFILKGAPQSATVLSGDPLVVGLSQLEGDQASPFARALASATQESINQLNNGSGGGFLTLQPNASAATYLNIATVQAVNFQSGMQLVLRGNGLGQTQGSAGNANIFALQPLLTGGAGGGAGSSFAAIRPDMLADTNGAGTGTGFAYYVPGYGFRPLTSAELATNYATSINTQNFGVTGTPTIQTTIGTLSSITSSGGAFQALGDGSILTLTSGGILATAGTTTFNGGQLAAGNQLEVWANGGNVVLNTAVTGSGSQGLAKGGSGTLTIGAQQFLTGIYTINGGTLTFSAGAPDYAILYYPTNGTPQTEGLTVNAGTVDLNNHNLVVGNITNNNPLANSGGTITNSGLTNVTLTSSAGNATTGVILAGNLNYVRNGNVTTVLTSPSTYNGFTTIRGGTLTLRDQGSLLNTSALNLNFANLTLEQTGLNAGSATNPTRLSSSVPVVLQGANITLLASGSADGSLTLNDVTLAATGGYNQVTPTPFVNSGSTAVITFGNLKRTAGSGATLNINGFYNNTNTLGQGTTVYNGSAFFVTQFNGAALAANTVIPWAVTNASDLTVQSAANGWVTPGTFGTTAYSANTFGTGVLDNYTASSTLPTGTTLVGAFRPSGVVTLSITGATDTLNIESGALTVANGNSATIIGSTAGTGQLTAGGSAPAGATELDVWNNQNTLTINAKIIDNPNGAKPVIFVKYGGGAVTLAAANTYSGGTIVNQGTLNINVAGATGTGALTMNNANITESVAQAFSSAANINLNGGSILTLTGNNTIGGVITFNNTGGTTTPTITGGNILLTGSIVSNNPYFSATPTIASTVDLQGAARTITTNLAAGDSPDTLSISGVISNGSINKQGLGNLILSGANTFAGGITVGQGGLIFASDSSTTATTGTGGPIASGSAGIGTITLGDGAKLYASNGTRTILNPITVQVNSVTNVATLDMGIGQSALVLNGVITFLGSGTPLIDVEDPLTSLTLANSFTGSNSPFTKIGFGTLILSNPGNSFTGGVTVTGGTLQMGAVNAFSQLAPLTVGASGTFNIANNTTVVGSLAGSGLVTNLSGSTTFLRAGFNNADSAFSGRFAGSSQNNTAFFLDKIGTGTLALNQDTGLGTTFNGTMQISQGTLMESGAGQSNFSTYTLLTGGTLLLNDSGQHVNGRLGAASNALLNRIINIGGGNLMIIGNASTGTTEQLNKPGQQGGTLSFTSGAGVITLSAGAGGPLNLILGTLGNLSGGGTGLIRGTNLGQPAGPGVANIFAVSPGNPIGSTGTNFTTTVNVRPDIIAVPSATGTGSDANAEFLTEQIGIGGSTLRALDASELAPGIYRGILGLQTNVAQSSNQLFGTYANVNSLTFNTGAGLTGIATPAIFTVNSGGWLIKDATNGVSGGIITAGGNQLIIHQYDTVHTFNVNSYLYSSNSTVNWIKAGPGAMSINTAQVIAGSNVTVNAGLLTLNSGAANTLPIIATNTTPLFTSLTLNGGTVDLNGQSQIFASLNNNNALANSGGTIANFTGTIVTLTSAGTSSTTFGGAITGNLNFVRSSNSTANNLVLTSANTYAGTTVVRGGTLSLRDQGEIQSTGVITLQPGAILQLDDTGLYTSGTSLSAAGLGQAQRINSGASITLNGGTLLYLGAQSAASVPQVTLGVGGSTIQVTASANTQTPSVLNIASFGTRATGGTVNFVSGTGTLGQLLGGNGEVTFTSVPTLTSGIIGGWATVGGTDFATYLTPNGSQGGVGALGATGFTAYSAHALTAGVAGDNINVSTAVTDNGTKTINALKAGANVTLASGETLTLQSGGLLFSAAATMTGGTAVTSGTGELDVYTNANVTLSTPVIGTTVLVKSGANILTLSNDSSTGGVIVNGGTLALASALAAGSSLTINNGATVTETAANFVPTGASGSITIVGGGTLTLTGTNTIAGLITLNSNGGTATPTINTSGTTSLQINGGVTVNSDNLSFTPTITSAIDLNSGARTLNVGMTTAGLGSPDGLILSGIISSATGSIVKNGNSGVVLSGANTFGAVGSTSFTLNNGLLVLGLDTSATAVGSAFTNGPVGLGTLVVNGGGILSSNATHTILNPVTVTSGVPLDFALSNNGVNTTLNGLVTFSGASPTATVSVDSPFVTGTLGAGIAVTSGSAALVKNGPGTLVISTPGAVVTGVNPISGTTINDGTLTANFQYALGGTPSTAPYTAAPTITLNGGAYNVNAANTFFTNAVAINANALLSATQGNTAIGPVTVGASATAIGNQGGQTTTIFGDLTFNGGAARTIFNTNDLRLLGGSGAGNHGLIGTANLTKAGFGNMYVNGNGAGYSGVITVEQGYLVSLDSNASDTPFGTPPSTGPVIKPGAGLRIANAANLPHGATINSDAYGLGALGLEYSGAVPANVQFFGAGGAPYAGGIELDVQGFGQALNLATLEASNASGGKLVLGSSAGGSYTAATLGAGQGNIYRLGGGGSTLSINAPVLAGANALEIGAVRNVTANGLTSAANLVNSGGTVVLNTANNFTGTTTIGLGSVLQLGDSNALGNGASTILFNGGTLQQDPLSGVVRLNADFAINNAITFVGDGALNSGTSNSNFVLNGNVQLSSNSTTGSVYRLLTVNNSSGLTIINGNISNGGATTASLVKAGAGALVLGGTNTYTGVTQINAGTLVLTENSDIGASSGIQFMGGNLGFWNPSGSLATPANLVLSVPQTFVGGGIYDVGANLTITDTASISGLS